VALVSTDERLYSRANCCTGFVPKQEIYEHILPFHKNKQMANPDPEFM
jgi:hypothetical protein